MKWDFDGFAILHVKMLKNILEIPHLVLETTRRQARFETPKFNKRCNYIEMTRKEITRVEGVTNYNHKTITCKLTPNFKVSRCTQNHSNILSPNCKVVVT
jgi:hypothetical protein